MNRRKTAIFKAGLDTLYYSRAHRALAPFTCGAGIIFTLHNVFPGAPPAFAPNRILTVTPEFLEAVVVRIRAAGLDLVGLDEAQARLRGEGDGRRFACLTFDDGYRDNLEHAYPVLKRHDVPMAIYVATCMPDGTAELWWLALEFAIAAADSIEVPTAAGTEALSCDTLERKYDTYETVYWRLRAMDEEGKRATAREIAARAGIDMAAVVRDLSMTWEEIARLSADPLVTIGAHTVTHSALAKLTDAQVEYEMAESRRLIGEHTGVRPRHFAYPYGDAGSAGPREFALANRLGFATAVTTRPGVLYPEHGDHLTALPRVSLNGDYQSLRYLDLFLTGAPFALFNRFRRVDAA
ncbi:polysaccharide deacetylase family protein [Microbaculum sp. FT89]|uniref:polysaccharide deacetylase family protein n=1 Tax=Microbaculum sp. FT89 TaxID=3447298 RepID=UPI003F533773